MNRRRIVFMFAFATMVAFGLGFQVGAIFSAIQLSMRSDRELRPETVVVVKDYLNGERHVLDPVTCEDKLVASSPLLDSIHSAPLGASIISNQPLTESQVKRIIDRVRASKYGGVLDDVSAAAANESQTRNNP